MERHAEFLELLLKSQAELRMFLSAMIRNRQEREDLLQEVAIVLWEKFDEYDAARPFGAWARGIAANKVMQSRTRQNRQLALFPPEAVAAIQDAFDRRPADPSRELEALAACLGLLPRRSREMLQLRYDAGLEVKELASRIGLSPDAAFKGLARLRLRLRDCIERRVRAAEEGRS